MAIWILSSTVLILAVIILRSVLKGRISLRMQYALWVLVLIRLLIPWDIGSSVLSLQNHLPHESPIRQETTIAVDKQEESAPVSVTPQVDKQPEAQTPIEPQTPTVPAKAALSASEVLTAIWLSGVTGGTLILLWSNRQFSHRLKAEREQIDLDFPLSVYLSTVTETPCLFGFFHPVVYVTKEVLEDKQALQHVIEHEYTHYRHGDHLWSLLRGICLVLHWYNPLVWLAVKLSKYDAELACDEGTIQRIGEAERISYGRTLVGLTCTQQSLKDWTLTATTMTGSKNSLKERVLFIAKQPKKTVIGVTAMILVMAFAVGCTYTGKKNDSFHTDKAAASATAQREAENWNISHVEEVASVLDYGKNFSYQSVKLKTTNSEEIPSSIEIQIQSPVDFIGKQSQFFNEKLEKQLKEQGAILLNLFDAPKVGFRYVYNSTFHYEWVLAENLSTLEKQKAEREAQAYLNKLSGMFSDEEAKAAVDALNFPESNYLGDTGIILQSMEFKGHTLILNFGGGNLNSDRFNDYLRHNEVQLNSMALADVLNLSFVVHNYESDHVKYWHITTADEMNNWGVGSTDERVEAIKAAIAQPDDSDASYSGGTNWSPVSREEYLSAMNSTEIESWLNSCTDDSKAYALKYNTEYKGLKRTQWLVYFAKHCGTGYNTGVDYGLFSNTVKVDFHHSSAADGPMFMYIHHTDDSSRHKGKLKVYYDGKEIDCEITEVNFDLSYMDKLLEQYRQESAEETPEETPSVSTLELEFPQATLYAPTGYYQYSHPFVLMMDNPKNWTTSDGGRGADKLPKGGELIASAYLYEEGRDDAVAYVFANTFLSNQYEELQFPNEQYYQTVFPDLRLGSANIWNPFTSVKLTDSGEVGICDIWFTNKDFIKQNPNVSMAAAPHYESKGILAYDNELKVYVAIGFAADYDISEEQLKQLAESLTMTSTAKNKEFAKAIIPAISEQEFTRNYEIFEKYFLGYWNNEWWGTKGLNYEDAELVDWMGFGGTAEDEENAYLWYIGGGTGQLFRIEKDEPDVMYFHRDWQSHPEYNMSWAPEVYHRVDNDVTLKTDVTQPGPVSSMAISKLYNLYGIDLKYLGNQVTLEDGNQWESFGIIEMPRERFWLVESPTAEKVVFIRQLFAVDGEDTLRRDIQIEAKNIDGNWTVTHARELDHSEPIVNKKDYE